MTTPTDADAKLRELASKATPGPWTGLHGEFDGSISLEHDQTETTLTDDTAAFIAACSPDRILALLDGKAAAEREWDEAWHQGAGAARQDGARVAAENEVLKMANATLRTSLTRAEARVRELEQVLSEISDEQPKMLESFRRNGIVFDSLGNDPKNWQHVAFTIYTNLCEIDKLARAALPAQPKEGEAATRSADTDGDEAQGAESFASRQSRDGVPGDDGADLTE